MSITIRTLKRRPGGRESVRTLEFAGDEISIGRGADNDLAITDLTIALQHAKLTHGQDGIAVLVLFNGCSARINKRLVTGKTRKLPAGSRIRLGRYELHIEETEDPGNITVTLEQVETIETTISANDEYKVFNLASALPSKRIMAWVFSLSVLGFFLMLPIWAFKSPDSDMIKSLPIQADLSWNSGSISLMHANLKNDCKSCHTDAFVAVKDKACFECHTTLKDHASKDNMKIAKPVPSDFGRKLDKISVMFARPVERCASCHVEHNTRAKIIPTSQKLCIDCHRNLDKSMANLKLENVSDFGNDHPQFSPSVITVPDFKSPVMTRMSLDGNPKGSSGLKFPHKLHLKDSGGVARMASRLGEKHGFADGLDCADCHRPEAGGALFDPVNMQQDCAVCHDLGFEDDGGYLRTMRHGEPEEVIATMRDFYLAKALSNIRDAEMNSQTRRRPGRASSLRDLNRRELAFKQADNRTAAKVNSIFSKGGACFDCHVIDRPHKKGSLNFRIRPISVNDQFYFKSTFDHKTHDIGNLECQTCHKAKESEFSSDVLLPKIEICRDCHVGEDRYRRGGKMAKGTLPTTCLTCHAYHGGPHAGLMEAPEKQ